MIETNVNPILMKHSVSFPNKIAEMVAEEDGNLANSNIQGITVLEDLYNQLWKDWNKIAKEYIESNNLTLCCFESINWKMLELNGETQSAAKAKIHQSKHHFIDHSMKRAVSLKSGMPKIGCLSKYETKITKLACKDYKNSMRF